MPRPLHLTAAVAALAASALVAAPAVHALDGPSTPSHVVSPALPTADAARLAPTVPGLDQHVVARYGRYVHLGADGHFAIDVPRDVATADPAGASAARAAVTTTNRLVDHQRAELERRHENAAVTAMSAPGKPATAVLPMGEHATFQAEWWGMTFTLDATATQQLTAALDATKDVQKLLDTLGSVGIVIAPEVAGVVKAVLAGVATLREAVAKNTTADGLVIKALWVLIPWLEKPKGPFVPAPPREEGLTGRPGAGLRTGAGTPAVVVG